MLKYQWKLAHRSALGGEESPDSIEQGGHVKACRSKRKFRNSGKKGNLNAQIGNQPNLRDIETNHILKFLTTLRNKNMGGTNNPPRCNLRTVYTVARCDQR